MIIMIMIMILIMNTFWRKQQSRQQDFSLPYNPHFLLSSLHSKNLFEGIKIIPIIITNEYNNNSYQLRDVYLFADPIVGK